MKDFVIEHFANMFGINNLSLGRYVHKKNFLIMLIKNIILAALCFFQKCIFCCKLVVYQRISTKKLEG